MRKTRSISFFSPPRSFPRISEQDFLRSCYEIQRDIGMDMTNSPAHWAMWVHSQLRLDGMKKMSKMREEQDIARAGLRNRGRR